MYNKLSSPKGNVLIKIDEDAKVHQVILEEILFLTCQFANQK